MSSVEIARANAAQLAATQPDISSWITANAGSGKTTVLTNRVARVLLGGTPPARILCLTYTKAAAAEMQNRLFAQLGKWSMLPDDPLRKALAELGVTALDPSHLTDARRLFARALETPGGLKIQTIHAFCESLLRRFPLEAGLSPNFELLDERAAALLRESVLDDMAEGEDAATLAALLAHSGQLDAVLPAILRYQDLFDRPANRATLAAALGVAPDLDDATILHDMMQGLTDADIDWLASQIAGGSQTEQKAAATLIALPNMTETAALDALIDAFLTKGGTLRKSGFPSVKTKAIDGAEDLIADISERALAALETRKALAALDRGLALHHFAIAFLARYHTAKSLRQRLDFDDLIRNASALLHQSEMAAWVLFRLDGGIDHILIDEAQDTSPAQWRIFTTLAEEILAGEGARDTMRTLFVVGDVKQSIFSFQGADPAGFSTVEADFAKRLAARETPLQQASLLHSFRSSPPILALVDAVFANSADGLGGAVSHLAAFPEMPGRVDIWPFAEAEDKIDKRPVFDLTAAAAQPDPEQELGRRIAAQVAQMLADKTPLPGANRPVRPGDFLILVRRRKVLYGALIRALKSEGVAIAGADRLKLGEELAVRDLLAALRFAASPHDDLSLAVVLRSPLVGYSEAQLYALAQGRSGALWAAVQAAGAPPLLTTLLDQADFQRPYDLLELILQDHGGRAALLARLGAECEEAVDELLAQALNYETSAIPTLGGFLEWIESGDVEVKRQVDEASDQLRIMTVHGAKGLEAPIVILPDTAQRDGQAETAILGLGEGAVAWGHNATANPEQLQSLAQAAQARRADEDLRLLYVAMTRAKNWLIVTGAGKLGTPEKPGWYLQILNAAQTQPGVVARSDGGLSVFHHWQDTPGTGIPEVDMKAASKPQTPAWFTTAVATPPRPVQSLSPSDLGGAHALPSAAGQDAETAMAYGSAVHDMLEQVSLLDADLYAAFFASQPETAARAEVSALLQCPEITDIFAQSPLAEVGFSADIVGLGPVSGRIDVLSVTPDCVTAYDFKTNRDIPTSPAQAPEALLRQMGAYRAALAQIYPGRRIETTLIWTRTGQIMTLDAGVTDPALDRARLAAAAP